MARPEAVVSVQAVRTRVSKRAASQRRQCEHVQIIFSQKAWVSPLNTPRISSVSGHPGTNEPHKGTSGTNECKPVQVCLRGSMLRSSREQLTRVWLLTANSCCLPAAHCSIHTGVTLPVSPRSESEDDEGTRAGPLLSNLGVPVPISLLTPSQRCPASWYFPSCPFVHFPSISLCPVCPPYHS